MTTGATSSCHILSALALGNVTMLTQLGQSQLNHALDFKCFSIKSTSHSRFLARYIYKAKVYLRIGKLTHGQSAINRSTSFVPRCEPTMKSQSSIKSSGICNNAPSIGPGSVVS